MAYCKKFIILFLILFLILFNFSYSFATEDNNYEYLSFTLLNNMAVSSSGSLAETSGWRLYYLPLEEGYTYYINLNYTNNSRVGYSNSLSNGSTVYDFQRFTSSGSFSLVYNSSQYDYLFFNYSINADFDDYEIYRVKNSDMTNAIYDLANNVGPNALWGVFGSGIDFVFVIVIVALGIFIIYKLISGFSKGKSKI